MTKEEIKSYLTKLGFTYERDSEYNRDVYINEKLVFDNKTTKLVLYVCYYTIRFEWWYDMTKKVGTSFYVDKILPNFDSDFITKTLKLLQSKYNIQL